MIEPTGRSFFKGVDVKYLAFLCVACLFTFSQTPTVVVRFPDESKTLLKGQTTLDLVGPSTLAGKMDRFEVTRLGKKIRVSAGFWRDPKLENVYFFRVPPEEARVLPANARALTLLFKTIGNASMVLSLELSAQTLREQGLEPQHLRLNGEPVRTFYIRYDPEEHRAIIWLNADEKPTLPEAKVNDALSGEDLLKALTDADLEPKAATEEDLPRIVEEITVTEKEPEFIRVRYALPYAVQMERSLGSKPPLAFQTLYWQAPVEDLHVDQASRIGVFTEYGLLEVELPEGRSVLTFEDFMKSVQINAPEGTDEETRIIVSFEDTRGEAAYYISPELVQNIPLPKLKETRSWRISFRNAGRFQQTVYLGAPFPKALQMVENDPRRVREASFAEIDALDLRSIEQE